MTWIQIFENPLSRTTCHTQCVDCVWQEFIS